MNHNPAEYQNSDATDMIPANGQPGHLPLATGSAVVCPGCGWTGDVAGLTRHGSCPQCEYENGSEPFRLLTVSELLADETGEYASVNMGRFLRAITPFLSPNTKISHGGSAPLAVTSG